MTTASVFGSLRRHPSAGALQAVQLLGLLLYPVMADTGAGRALFNTFGVLVLALVVWIVMRSPTNWIGAQLDGAAVPELHDPVQRWPRRRPADQPVARALVMLEQFAGVM
jgi:hypothetical protein